MIRKETEQSQMAKKRATWKKTQPKKDDVALRAIIERIIRDAGPPLIRRLSEENDALQQVSTRLLEENKVLGNQIEQLMERLDHEGAAPRSYRWKDGHGKAWAPTEMTEEHLRNAVTYCARKLAGALTQTVYLDNVTYLVDGLHHLLAECKRRGYRV